MQRVRNGAALVALLVVVGGCADAAGPDGPFTLMFRGDASFVAAHANQPLSAAIVEAGSGDVVARRSATIAADGASAFSLAFSGVLEPGVAYELVYWVDANAGGGAPGACDAPPIDLQWRLEVPAASRNVSLDAARRPSEAVAACEPFTVDVAVALDEGFQSAHAGQDVVVRLMDNATQARRDQILAQIPAAGAPAFQQTFQAPLVVGRSYRLEVWVDSNIGGGAPGVCDPPANDRQWSIDLGTTGEDPVAFTIPYSPGAMWKVCPFTV